MKDYLRNFKDFSKNSVALSEGTYEEGGEDDRKYALLKVRPENYELMIDKLQDMNINHTRHSNIDSVIKVYTDGIPDKVLYKLTHDVWVDKFIMKDDGFTGDLDQAGDGIVTLDSLAMDEFGMTYDQLGPGEKEWCRDEYDSL